MQRFVNKLLPFFLAGMAIVVLAFGLMLLVYLLLFGAVIGLILFVVNWLREQLFPPKKPIPVKKERGRIIDSDDWKVL